MPQNSISQKLNSLSDMELYTMISTVCAAVGMDQKKTASLISDIPKLRRMLSSLSDKQLTSLLSSLSDAQKNELYEKLENGNPTL